MRYAHGTRTAYVLDKCRCDDCREANRIGMRQRIIERAKERWNPETSKYVDAAPVRAHVEELMAQGMGWKRVAIAAGLNPSSVYPLLYGMWVNQPDHPRHRPRRKRVLRTTADKLLAVRLELADGALVDGGGTRLRMRALVSVGWPMSRLARMVGVEPSNAGDLFHGRRKVRKSTADAVRDLYDRLWETEPTATSGNERRGITLARRYAAERRWPMPMDLDDDRIDQPGYRVHGKRTAA